MKPLDALGGHGGDAPQAAAKLRTVPGIGLLVPALMRLLGDANGWMPEWTRIALRLPTREPALLVAAEGA